MNRNTRTSIKLSNLQVGVLALLIVGAPAGCVGTGPNPKTTPGTVNRQTESSDLPPTIVLGSIEISALAPRPSITHEAFVKSVAALSGAEATGPVQLPSFADDSDLVADYLERDRITNAVDIVNRWPRETIDGRRAYLAAWLNLKTGNPSEAVTMIGQALNTWHLSGQMADGLNRDFATIMAQATGAAETLARVFASSVSDRQRYVLSFLLAQAYARIGQFSDARYVLTSLLREDGPFRPIPADDRVAFYYLLADYAFRLGEPAPAADSAIDAHRALYACGRLCQDSTAQAVNDRILQLARASATVYRIASDDSFRTSAIRLYDYYFSTEPTSIGWELFSSPERHQVTNEVNALKSPSAATAHVDITRDPESLQLFANLQRATLTGCYQAELVRNHAFVGAFALPLSLDERGKVTVGAAYRRSTNGSIEQLEGCVRARIETWRFPASASSRTRVELPLDFQRGEVAHMFTSDAIMASRRSSVSGLLLDRKTGEPVPSATVSLWSSSDDRRVTTTDDFGLYRFLVPPGFYNMSFENGESRATCFVSVEPGQDHIQNSHIDVFSGEVIRIFGRKTAVIPPKPMNYSKRKTPPYSDDAITMDAWTRAWLLLDIDEQGEVRRIKFLKRPGYSLEKIAEEEVFKLRFQPARDAAGQAIRVFTLWLIEWPSYGWMKAKMGITTRLPSVVGASRRYRGVPCRGSGPLNLGSTYPVYRDCSVPDLSKDLDNERWIGRHR